MRWSPSGNDRPTIPAFRIRGDENSAGLSARTSPGEKRGDLQVRAVSGTSSGENI